MHLLPAALLALMLSLTLASCGGSGGDDDPPTGEMVARETFQSLAAGASCADLRNRLFVIDNKLVLWDKASNCADAAYALSLFGTTPQKELCSQQDSLAGPRTECHDAQYVSMFDTISRNLAQADLGLGAGHTVERLAVAATRSSSLPFHLSSARVVGGSANAPVVIRDQAAWEAFAARVIAGAPAYPQPEFPRQMAVAVISAIPNPCNPTRIARIASDSQQLVVEYVDPQVMTLQACPPFTGAPVSLAVLDASPLNVTFANATSAQLGFNQIAKSDQSGMHTPMASLVRDNAQWSSIWQSYIGSQQPAPTLPTIDFNQRMVAALARGTRPSGCETYGLPTVWRSNGKIRITIQEMLPGPTALCAAVTLSPALLLDLERSEEPVEFQSIPKAY